MTINTMMLLFAIWVLVAIVLSLVIARVFGAGSRADAEARRQRAEQARDLAAQDARAAEPGTDTDEPRKASGGK